MMVSAEERTGLNWFLWAVVLLLIAVGVVLNHVYTDTVVFAVRLAIGIVYAIVVVLLASMTAEGKRFWQFARDARIEARKVVWPTRQETIQTTLLVLVMVVATALILWGLDVFLMWAITKLTGQ